MVAGERYLDRLTVLARIERQVSGDVGVVKDAARGQGAAHVADGRGDREVAAAGDGQRRVVVVGGDRVAGGGEADRGGVVFDGDDGRRHGPEHARAAGGGQGQRERAVAGGFPIAQHRDVNQLYRLP